MSQLVSTFGSWDVEKSARHCGAKHRWKSICTKHLSFGALLEVEPSKKCTRLWREAHLEVNMLKSPQVRAAFGRPDVEKVHAIVAKHISKSKVQKTAGFKPVVKCQL